MICLQYYQRYKSIVDRNDGTKELFLHPPPFNIITLGLLLLSSEYRTFIARKISKLMFWIENLIFLGLFLIYNLFLTPLIYFKVFLNVIMFASKKNKISRVIVWIVFGLLIIFGWIICDIAYTILLLNEYNLPLNK